MRRFVALSAVVVLLSSATLAHATFFNYTSSFLTESSAGTYSQSAWSPWSTGYLSTGMTTLNTFGYYSVPITNLPVWDKDGTYDTYGHAWKNVGSSAIQVDAGGGNFDQVEAGQTCMMSGNGNLATAIRWTAPTAGNYAISASFSYQGSNAAQWGPVDVYIRHGNENAGITVGNTLFSGTIDKYIGSLANNYADASSYGTTSKLTYSGSVALAAGETVDFIANEEWLGRLNWAGVTATVTSVVPEPTTGVLLVIGLIGLLCYAWRKRK